MFKGFSAVIRGRKKSVPTQKIFTTGNSITYSSLFFSGRDPAAVVNGQGGVFNRRAQSPARIETHAHVRKIFRNSAQLVTRVIVSSFMNDVCIAAQEEVVMPHDVHHSTMPRARSYKLRDFCGQDPAAVVNGAVPSLARAETTVMDHAEEIKLYRNSHTGMVDRIEHELLQDGMPYSAFHVRQLAGGFRIEEHFKFNAQGLLLPHRHDGAAYEFLGSDGKPLLAQYFVEGREVFMMGPQSPHLSGNQRMTLRPCLELDLL